MKTKDRKDLRREIDHIFESGANAIRIEEMVVSFIDRRYIKEDAKTENYTGKHECPKCGRILSIPSTLDLCPVCDNETEDDGGL